MKFIKASELANLTERSLRAEVLIPLFQAMGFKEVTETHGSDELGKDIVMWQPDVIGGQKNYAVVVKAKKISVGPAGSQEVCRQVRECFGSSYIDPVTLKEQRVDRVIVVTSSKFTQPARKSIRSELETSQLLDRTDIIDGETLRRRLEEYLPRHILWDRLKEAGTALNELSEDWEFSLRTDPGGVSTLLVSEKNPEAHQTEPIGVKLHFTFPDTFEGRQKRAEYIRFLETGKPLSLTEEFVEDIELPEFLEALSAKGEIEEMRLLPTALPPSWLFRLEVFSNRNLAYVYDYVHFTDRYGGTKEYAIKNVRQPIPIKIALVFPKNEDGKSRVEFSFKGYEEELSTFQHLRWFQLLNSLAPGARVCFRDMETFQVGMTFDLEQDENLGDSRWELALLSKLMIIQERTGVVFKFKSTAISQEAMINADLVLTAMSGGRVLLHFGECNFTVKSESAEKIVEENAIEIPAKLDDYKVSILGSEVSLGPAYVTVRGFPQRTSSATESAGEVSYRIELDKENLAFLLFPRWLTKRPVVEVNRGSIAKKPEEETPDAEPAVV